MWEGISPNPVDGMKYLVDSLAINHFVHAPQTKDHPKGATQFAVNYLKEKKPMYCAVIFEYPDHTGHTYKWESKEYYEKLDELPSFQCRAESYRFSSHSQGTYLL